MFVNNAMERRIHGLSSLAVEIVEESSLNPIEDFFDLSGRAVHEGGFEPTLSRIDQASLDLGADVNAERPAGLLVECKNQNLFPLFPEFYHLPDSGVDFRVGGPGD